MRFCANEAIPKAEPDNPLSVNMSCNHGTPRSPGWAGMVGIRGTVTATALIGVETKRSETPESTPLAVKQKSMGANRFVVSAFHPID